MVTATELDVEKLSALYDRIYDIADRLIKKHNPCNIHIETKPAKDLCWNPIFPEKLITDIYCNSKYSTHALCCTGCTYWDTGCTIKCLACKLFVCGDIIYKNEYNQLVNKINKLHQIARKNRLPASSYYLSKEDWLKQMEE